MKPMANGQQILDGAGDPAPTFRYATASMGLGLILTGVLMSLYLFFAILGAINKPDRFAGQIQAMSKALGGDDLVVALPGTVSPATPEDQGAPQAEGESDDSAGRTRRPGARIPIARPLGAFLLIVLLALLTRLSVAIIGAGGKLVGIATPYHQFMRTMLAEIKSGRTPGEP